MSFNMQKQQIVKDFQRSGNDTGSTEVQVALLTTRIENLTNHLSSNKKDFSCKHGLICLVSQRKRLLEYLKNKNEARYLELIGRLGLKR